MGIHHPTFEAPPKPLSLTLQSEEERDAYVARLEQLLDACIVPADIVEQREMISTTLDAIREYPRRVIARFPAHDRYVEVFVGGARLYCLRPPAKVEVVNDVSGELINLYRRVVEHHPEAFVRQLKWALTSRQVFEWLMQAIPETLADPTCGLVLKTKESDGDRADHPIFICSPHQSVFACKGTNVSALKHPPGWMQIFPWLRRGASSVFGHLAACANPVK